MEGLEEGQRKILELLKSGKSPEEIMRAYDGTM
jgi:DNA-binding CsgD family transcriptional regulator